MLGREHQECPTVKRVGTRGQKANLLIAFVDFEIDFRAFAVADPIALKQFYSFGPITFVEPIKQSLRIRCDAQHPLTHRPSNNREPATFTFSVYDFLIGQNRAQLRTPVDRDLSNIGEPNTVRISAPIS